jgi:O-acetyl-ADP-ribose deacetylase (regulator of RNase III)
MSTLIPVIIGDLIETDVDVIVQQCNCLTITAQGLSQQIKDQLKVDPYGHRKRLAGRKNCAIKDDRAKVGTIKLYHLKNRRPSYVACLFAQFSPGKPGSYYHDIIAEHQDPRTGLTITDNAEQRMIWFQRCLNSLSSWMIKANCQTIAFPYLIGCGLAGGSWDLYEKMITEWSNKNINHFKVYFVKLVNV